jgi:flavin-dependent dehydrogenase
MDYDVIIAGGSFAGLSAATQLKGKFALLVEPNPIGQVQTSACATMLAVLEATGTMDSLLQVHDTFVLHLPRLTYRVPLPDPFCTFDYRLFCERLLARCDAEILPAAVRGRRGQVVYTTTGTFDAPLLIDASGWRAALATSGRQQWRPHQGKSFGIETHIPCSEEGLHFWYQPGRLGKKTVTWLFPTGAQSRAGIGSYSGETRLKSRLEWWLASDWMQSKDGFHKE